MHEGYPVANVDCVDVPTHTNIRHHGSDAHCQIQTSGQALNMDSGLQLSTVWSPILHPSPQSHACVEVTEAHSQYNSPIPYHIIIPKYL